MEPIHALDLNLPSFVLTGETVVAEDVSFSPFVPALGVHMTCKLALSRFNAMRDGSQQPDKSGLVDWPCFSWTPMFMFVYLIAGYSWNRDES